MKNIKKLISIICAITILLSTLSCNIGLISFADAAPTEAAYTFDETDTNYWSAVKEEYATGNTIDMTFNVTSDGSVGKGLTITYGLYDKAHIIFNYTLKSNTRYFLTYQYRGNNATAALSSASSVVCTDANASVKEKIEAFSLESGWPITHDKWKTRTIMFETGDNIVSGDRNKLAFFLSFGNSGKIYLDNIHIHEVVQNESYSTDFSNGLEADGIFNYNASTDLEVVSDPADASNKVLKLHKNENAHAQYNLFIPVKLVAGNTYTVEYKYKTDCSKQVGLNQGAKVGVLNTNGREDPKHGVYTQFSTILCGFTSNTYNASEWPKIPTGNNWITKTYTFEATEEMVNSSSGAVGISFQLYSTDPTDALNVYMDDIKVTKNAATSKSTVYINGEPKELIYPIGEQVELPLAQMSGYVYEGLYSDSNYENRIGSEGDKIIWEEASKVYYEKWTLIENIGYTFDEENTDYWSVVGDSANSSKLNSAITSDGSSGKGLTITYALYDKAHIIFDYNLKSNTKYFLTYQYRGNNATAALSSASSVVCTDVNASEKEKIAAFSLESGWPITHDKWKTRTIMFETGDNIVSGDRNKLAFFLSFGNSGKIYLDNIHIHEVVQNESYSTDFSNGLEADGIFNYNASTDLEVVSDPADSSNKVLKLHKNESAHAPYSLFIPVQLVAGNSYTIEYKYKTDSSKQVGLNTGAKVGILNTDGREDPKHGVYTQFSTILCGFTSNTYNANEWPKIPVGDKWITKTYTFEATEEMVNSSSGAVGISFQIYSTDPTDALNVYMDDIKVIKNAPISRSTVYVNGVAQEIGYAAESEVALPLADMPGYVYDGLYSDNTYSELIGSEGDKIIWPADSREYYEKWSLMGDKKYTFEDTDNEDDTFMAIAVPSASAIGGKDNSQASVSVVEDGKNNHSLKITTKSYINVVVNFGFEFAPGEDYRITYKIRRGDKAKVIDSSGVYIGKNAGTKDLVSSLQAYRSSDDAASLLGDSLAPLYEYTALDAWNVDGSLPIDNWNVYSAVISPENVDKDCKYLTLCFKLDPADTEIYTDLYIDDITIENIDISTVKIYANDEALFYTNDIGSKVNLPLSDGKYGYEFEGLYTDSAYNNKVSLQNGKLVWPETDTIYYEKWVKSNKPESAIGSGAVFDFESAEKRFLSYGLKGKQENSAIVTEPGNGSTCLKVALENDSSALINFNFDLDSYSKYRITYSLKGENCTVVQSTSAESGIYIGKSTAANTNAQASGLYEDYLGKKLTRLYHNSSAVNAEVSTGWHKYSWEFDTAYITGDMKKLTFAVHTVSSEGNDPAIIYFDDITIEKIGIPDSANEIFNIKTFDFEGETTSYLNTIAEKDSSAEIVDDQNSTSKVLKLSSNKSSVAVNFDYLLNSNSTYKIAYDIRGNGISNLKEKSGIWVGDSFVKSGDSVVENLYKSKITDLGGNITSDWSHKEFTFTTGNDAVMLDYQYFTIVFENSSKAEIYIDNITIEKIASQTNATYTFEDKNNSNDTYLDYAIENGQKEAAVFVKTESDGNKYLSLNVKNNKRILVNLPFKPESNAKYRITYRVKGDTKIKQNAGDSGIYLGKSTGFTMDEAAIVDNISEYYGKRMSNFYGNTTGNSITVKSDWTKQSYQFTTDTLTGDFSYISFMICNSKMVHEEIAIDDIVIERVYDIEFVTNNDDIEVEKITDIKGAVYSYDWLSCAGYTVEGVYTDSEFENKYSSDTFTVSDEKKIYYVKYKKSSNDSAVFKFQNGSDVMYKVKNFSVQNDPTDVTNRAIAIKGTSQSAVVLPFELKEGKRYAVTFKYKSSGEIARVNVAIAAGKDDASMPVETYYDSNVFITTEKTRQYNIFGCDEHNMTNYTSYSMPYYVWQTRTVYFTATNIDSTYKYLTFTANVPEVMVNTVDADTFYIDDVSIKEVEAQVSFVADYEGQKIDVLPICGNVGDVISLPTELVKPFVVEAWYKDKEFKTKVENNFEITKKETTLYAKVKMNETTVFDFEDCGDLQFSYAKWLSSAAGITLDPTNPSNKVFRVNSRDWNYTVSRLDYQLVPERVYKISLKYKSIGQGNISNEVSSALVPSVIKRLENGYGVLDGKGNSATLGDGIMTFNLDKDFGYEWTTDTFLVGTGTNGPLINDTLKYLSLVIMDKSSTLNGLLFDDIIITDLGVYDPSFFPVNETSDWVIPTEDISGIDDWKLWELSDLNYEYSEDSNDNTYFEGSKETDQPEIENNESTSNKKLLKKKKVVVYSEANYTWIIIVCIAAVIIAVGVILLIFLKKKKKKQTSQ